MVEEENEEKYLMYDAIFNSNFIYSFIVK